MSHATQRSGTDVAPGQPPSKQPKHHKLHHYIKKFYRIIKVRLLLQQTRRPWLVQLHFPSFYGKTSLTQLITFVLVAIEQPSRTRSRKSIKTKTAWPGMKDYFKISVGFLFPPFKNFGGLSFQPATQLKLDFPISAKTTKYILTHTHYSHPYQPISTVCQQLCKLVSDTYFSLTIILTKHNQLYQLNLTVIDWLL